MAQALLKRDKMKFIIKEEYYKRTRPNESMRAGEKYRGKIVKETKAIKKDDGWYWRIIWED
jgi:hypothetical protein